jgi:hypothetical protein
MVRIDRNLRNFTGSESTGEDHPNHAACSAYVDAAALNIPDNEDWEGPNENAYAVWIGDDGERNLMIV